MTRQQLASAIAKREGKKSQARIGDIREILKLLAQLEGEHYMFGEGSSPLEVIQADACKVIAKLERKADKSK